jgi:hypothetical protein
MTEKCEWGRKNDWNEIDCRRIDEDDDVEFVEARQPPITRSRAAANGRGLQRGARVAGRGSGRVTLPGKPTASSSNAASSSNRAFEEQEDEEVGQLRIAASAMR